MKNIANRYFYRVDKQGRPVPGTLARMNRKPDHGKWVEVPADICCTPECGSSLLVAEITWPNSISSETDITINVCGQEIIINNIESELPISGELRFNAIVNAVDILNADYSALGTWYVIGDYISTTISPTIGLVPAGGCTGDFTVDVAIIP